MPYCLIDALICFDKQIGKGHQNKKSTTNLSTKLRVLLLYERLTQIHSYVNGINKKETLL